jgi:hypothetical protein
MNPLLIALNLASAIALLLLSYYGIRIFLHMRLGSLERGWKLVTEGIVITGLGFFLIAADHALPRASELYFYLDTCGSALSLSGVVFMLVGLHSHYSVWYSEKAGKESVSIHSPNPGGSKEEDKQSPP